MHESNLSLSLSKGHGLRGSICFKSMTSYLLFALSLLICLSLHAHVYGRELHGLKGESNFSLHKDTNVTPLQKELASPTKNFVEKAASQSNLLSKDGGYSGGQSLAERYLNKESPMNRPLPIFRDQYPLNFEPRDESPQIITHWAKYQSIEGEYYGTKATINVWSLQNIKSPDISASVIWVANRDDSPGNTNLIEAGWHVHPALYKDNFAHFFIFWTADNFQKTGCYNFDCPGFVHTNHSLLVPGYRLEPTSIFDGAQYYITLKIYKDPQTGDWLLFEGSGDAKNFVGYWPKTLFTSLANSASVISWGGVVTFSQPHTSPPMGSGHFYFDKEGIKAASFKHIQYVNDKGDLHDPIPFRQNHITDKEECYKVDVLDDSADHGGFDGWIFHFGGPGGCNN